MDQPGPSVAIFDPKGNLAAMQRSVLRSMALRHSTIDSQQALIKDLMIGRDLIILNWEQDWDDLLALVRTLRNKSASPDPIVGIVVVSPLLDGGRARQALDAGANSLVRIPFTAGDIANHVKYVSSKQWRFIDAPNYFGPDRRLRQGAPPEGVERRDKQCRVFEGAELASERARMRSTALAALDIIVAHTH